jgi:hypothetical protein
LVAELKFSVAFIWKIIKSIKDVIPTLLNLLCRPKADIEIRHQHIIFKNMNGVESMIDYPCILISFKKDVKIDVRSIKINNESLTCMLSRDKNYLRLNQKSKESHTVINNNIMRLVSDNWQNLNQQACWLDIKNLEQEALPLNFNKEMSHCIFSPLESAHVFAPKSKLVLSLNIDGSNYEYGISLIDACRVIVNYLASRSLP